MSKVTQLINGRARNRKQVPRPQACELCSTVAFTLVGVHLSGAAGRAGGLRSGAVSQPFLPQHARNAHTLCRAARGLCMQNATARATLPAAAAFNRSEQEGLTAPSGASPSPAPPPRCSHLALTELLLPVGAASILRAEIEQRMSPGLGELRVYQEQQMLVIGKPR